MECKDILEIILNMITIVVAIITPYITYRFTIKHLIKQEKINEYSEVLDMLYELKSKTYIFLTDDDFVERLKNNRAKILLFSSEKLFDEINKIYTELSNCKESYMKEREPQSKEEDEKQILKYKVTEKYVSDCIKKIVELMRKELKVKGKIEWEN